MPMIPVLHYPDFNGIRYSRTSTDLLVAEADHRIIGWTSITTEQSLTPGKAWGGRAKPQVRTRGKFEPKMSLKMWVEDWNLLQNKLETLGLASGLLGFMEVSFTLICTLYEADLGTTSWTGITKVATEQSTGNDDPVETSLELDVMDLLKDGVSAVMENSPLGQSGVSA